MSSFVTLSQRRLNFHAARWRVMQKENKANGMKDVENGKKGLDNRRDALAHEFRQRKELEKNAVEEWNLKFDAKIKDLDETVRETKEMCDHTVELMKLEKNAMEKWNVQYEKKFSVSYMPADSCNEHFMMMLNLMNGQRKDLEMLEEKVNEDLEMLEEKVNDSVKCSTLREVLQVFDKKVESQISSKADEIDQRLLASLKKANDAIHKLMNVQFQNVYLELQEEMLGPRHLQKRHKTKNQG